MSFKSQKTSLAFLGLGVASVLAVFAMSMCVKNNMTTCKKTSDLATTTALESAVNHFYTEYGKLPCAESRVITDTPEGVKFLTILLGRDENATPVVNTRAIKFLSVKEGKSSRNGLIYGASGNTVDGLFDFWGNPYTVELDSQYREHLHFVIGKRSIDLKGRRAAAYSPGPDHKLGTSDDVKTW